MYKKGKLLSYRNTAVSSTGELKNLPFKESESTEFVDIIRGKKEDFKFQSLLLWNSL